jgi:hypothetical protein
MRDSLKKIVLTETTLAVAITTITLLVAYDSIEQTRAIAATLVGLRALFAALNVVLTNAKHLALNFKTEESAKLVGA